MTLVAKEENPTTAIIEARNDGIAGAKIPDEFICPLTKELSEFGLAR